MKSARLLETMTWKEAEEYMNDDTLAVIPLGAAAKEHGYHLQLRNDFLIAEHLKEQILERLIDTIVLPTINYSYYPAFAEYPGSISLSHETASSMICEICLSVTPFGPKRFYVLNTGISTLHPLKVAAERLKQHNCFLRFTDLHKALETLLADLSEQDGGSHADEIETSIMLAIAPNTVRMELARRDFQKGAGGCLSRQEKPGQAFSESGVWGDATLANLSKGQKIVKCLVEHILKDIENLRLTATD